MHASASGAFLYVASLRFRQLYSVVEVTNFQLWTEVVEVVEDFVQDGTHFFFHFNFEKAKTNLKQS